MYYIYLLQDLYGKLYFGYTNNLKRRIREHQLRKVFTTRKMDKPRLIYYEAYCSEELAKKREKKLKQFGSAHHGLLRRLGLRKNIDLVKDFPILH